MKALKADPLPVLPISSKQSAFWASGLNEVGRPIRAITVQKTKSIKQQLASGKLGRTEAARKWIELGENELGKQYPANAESCFANALAASMPRSVEHGIASYNKAISLFYQGRYQLSANAFKRVIGSKEIGFSRKDAAMFLKHASACAEYHEIRAKQGITEPPHLDPLCGASGIAIVLKKLGRDHSESMLSSIVHHTGEGSTFEDLIEAANKLDLVATPLTFDSKGLKALFQVNSGVPVIAHVEHDHFIALVGADDSGVTYMCSDCGSWPGGMRKQTWEQWKLMEADAYLAFAKPNTPYAQALAMLPKAGSESKTLLRSITKIGQISEAQRIFAVLKANAVAYFWFPSGGLYCGSKPDALHCADCPSPIQSCPMYAVQRPGYSALAGDPVNLATGEEEYKPSADLKVYNPIGPSVVWGHIYNSLGNFASGFGQGWSHPYNIGIETKPAATPEGGGGSEGLRSNSGASSNSSLAGPGSTNNIRDGWVVLMNGAKVHFAPSRVTPPDSSTPVVSCVVGPGVPYIVNWVYDSGTGADYFTVTFPDRTVWTSTLSTGLVYDHLPGIRVLGTSYRPIRKITNRLGQYINLNNTTYTAFYGSEPRLTSITDSNSSNLLTVGYTSGGLTVSASDRYNRSVYYTVGNYACANVPTGFQTSFDLLDHVSQVVTTGTSSPPVRYIYEYQTHTNLESTEEVPYLRNIKVPNPTGSGTAMATFTYSNVDCSVTMIQDANGNRIYFSDTGSNQTKVTVKDSSLNTVWEGKYNFDANMNFTGFVDASNNTVVSYGYGAGTTPYRPSSITDGNSRSWSFTWDTYNNLLTKTTPKGITTTYTRDYTPFALGRLIEVQQGSKTSTTISYYEPGGLINTVNSPIPGQSGTGSRQTTTYTYDTLGNVLTITSPGNNAISSHTTTLNYTTDGSYSQTAALGQPLTSTNSLGKVTHFRYNSRGLLTSATDAIGNETTYSYNLANQVTQISLPVTGNTGSGHATEETTYLYTGGPVTSVDAKNESGSTVRTVSMTYGPEGELLTRTGSTEPVTLTYNALYQTKTLQDGNGNTTTYTYNTKGQATKVSYPGATGTNYDQVSFTSYDTVGNLLSRTDGTGNVTNYTYGDTDGLLSAVAYPSHTSQNIALTYDSYDRCTQITDGTGTGTSTYDDLGNTTSASRTYTGLSAKTFNYSYYADGSRSGLTTPGGNFDYYYDSIGRCTSMSSPAGTSSNTYQDNNWTASRTLPNSAYTSYSYNAVGALTNLQNKTSSSGTTLSQYNSFTYDGVFNALGLTASVPGYTSHSGTIGWSYDTKDRLTQETSSRLSNYTDNFAYDTSGNPTTFKGTTQSFNTDNQQTGTGFAYDGNGSPTTYKGTAFTYDDENRITQIGSSWTAGYRADGLRAWKQNGSTRTYFLYDGGNPILELDSSGNVIAKNVFGPDGLIARYASSSWTYYTFDHQGNVSQRLNAGGTVLSNSAYDAYGVENSSSTPGDPFGYNAKWGYYLDRETGLYLCRHRYYDAASGRWINRDPLGISGGVNLFGYCGQSPINRTDPMGLITFFGIGGDLDLLPMHHVGAIFGLYADPYGSGDWGLLLSPSEEQCFGESVDLTAAIGYIPGMGEPVEGLPFISNLESSPYLHGTISDGMSVGTEFGKEGDFILKLGVGEGASGGWGMRQSKLISIPKLFDYVCDSVCDKIDDESTRQTGHKFFPNQSEWANYLSPHMN